MGVVSYWVRRLGGKDPIDANEINFNSFVNWLRGRLVADCFFEFNAYSKIIRMHISKTPRSFLTLLALIFDLFKHPVFLIRFVKLRIFKDNFFRRLALEWVQQEKLNV